MPVKAETDTRCRNKILGHVCEGAICSVEPSKLEVFMGHRVYQCDTCGVKWKFSGTYLNPKIKRQS